MAIYMWREEPTPVTTAGIYHNETEGLISLSSDGENWITIADKNLGATQVWNIGDNLNQAKCGKLYQRGNNYGFPYSGTITTSSTQVNASTYGPGNYYSSNTFITGINGWDTSNNADLWGGTTNTLEARQGPCDTGFHIPNTTERTSIKNMFSAFGLGTYMADYNQYLFLPSVFHRSNSTGTMDSDIPQLYWTCINYSSAAAKVLNIQTNGAATVDNYRKQNGYPIRPFKNTPVTPDSTRTVLYQPN